MSEQQLYFPNYPTDIHAGKRSNPVISEFDQVREENRAAFQRVWDMGGGSGSQGAQGNQGWQGASGIGVDGVQGPQGFQGWQGVAGPVEFPYVEELYVAVGGSDTTGEGTFNKPYRTLQKAFDVYESRITIANWYMMRVIYAAPGIYEENVVVPPGRFELYGQNCIIKGSVTVRRSGALQNTTIDPLTGTHTDRMRHTLRFEGGAGQESSNYDGGIFIFGDLILSKAGDDDINTLELYLRNAVISGVLTPNNSITNPTVCSGGISMYAHSCRFNNIHSPLSVGFTFSMWDCRVSGSIMSHPLGTATYARVQFDSLRDTAINNINLANGEAGVYSSGDRQALCNVRFNTGTAFTAATATNYKIDSNTYADLLALGLTMTNITFTFIDNSSGLAYVPSDATKWVDPDPTTVKAALDRMASLLVTLNSGNPIP